MFLREKQFSRALLCSTAVILSACGSSSGSGDSDQLISRAIDGYLVGSQVFCDEDINGGTVAGGLLSCPADTVIARVRGGMDVGFDDTANEGGVPFVGELAAPADLGYITPLSTVALRLSSDLNGYDERLWDESVQQLAAVFGETNLDLSENAGESVQLVRLNTKINQIITSFSSTSDEYVDVMDSFAELVQNRAVTGTTLSLDTDVGATISDLNDLLQTSTPALYMGESELQAAIATVSSTNALIDEANSTEVIGLIALGALSTNAIVSIDPQRTLLTFHDYWYRETGSASIAQFESSNLVNNTYATVVEGHFDYLEINYDAFQINDDINNANVSLGVSLRSTMPGDDRELTILSPDVYLSATAGDSSSIVIEVKEGGLLYAEGTSLFGVQTETSIEFDEDNTFQSDSGFAEFNLWQARRALRDLGFDDILEDSGNFEVTAIISGLRITEIDGSEETHAEQYTIETGDRTMTGSGFRGYVTYDRY